MNYEVFSDELETYKFVTLVGFTVKPPEKLKNLNFFYFKTYFCAKKCPYEGEIGAEQGIQLNISYCQ